MLYHEEQTIYDNRRGAQPPIILVQERGPPLNSNTKKVRTKPAPRLKCQRRGLFFQSNAAMGQNSLHLSMPARHLPISSKAKLLYKNSTMVQPDPFTTTGLTENEKNADLALYLLSYLEQRREPQERIWRGERHVRTLQYTSHIAEALWQLDLKGLTDHLIEPAADWLLDPEFGRDVSHEESRALRIYPSRFKSLALLGRFHPARLGADFDELSQLLDPETGWIHDAPFDLSPALITMIWVDTLLCLDSPSWLNPALIAKRAWALQAISDAFEAWADRAAAALDQKKNLPDGLGLRASEVANSGDASYALDILLRSGHLSPDSHRADEARNILTAAIEGRRLGDMRRSDFLYCGLHLRQHFPQHTETRKVVESFITELRERYENNECQREPLSFHALVLRLLAAHHKEQLLEAVLRKLWASNREAAELQQRQAQEKLEEEFVSLVRQSTRIHLSPTQRITGTRARGEVYRVRFGLTTEATDEQGSPLSTPRDSLSLIVKKGPPNVLSRASERYRDLPEPLQRLFARHTDAVKGGDGSYLIMQDLADMLPLSEALTHLEDHSARRERQEKATAAATTVAATLRALHNHKRQTSLVSQQFDLSYLSPMANCLNQLCQPGAFPELKQWLIGSVEVNNSSYKPLDWYLKHLARFEQRLRPPTMGYAHGDCHSRNLMLNRDFTSARFVDIDTLTSAEDYIVDYGLLVEDVVVYQSLPYGDEAGRLNWDEIQTTRPGNPANTLDNWIAYPAFPQQSEVTLSFQRELLNHLEAYADQFEDKNWKKRLWLAIAQGLLLLASRQLTSHTVEPRRRPTGHKLVNDIKLVQVTYAEAIRLLHELHAHLEQKEAPPLPDVPFLGEHRPPPPPPQPATPEPSLVGALLQTISKELGDNVEMKKTPEPPFYTECVARATNRLFARMYTDRKKPALYLACRPDQLDDSHHLAQPAGADGLLTRITLTSDSSVAVIFALVRQAYQLAQSPPG